MAFVTDKIVVISKYLSAISRMKERDIRTNNHGPARKWDFSPYSHKVHYVAVSHIMYCELCSLSTGSYFLFQNTSVQ